MISLRNLILSTLVLTLISCHDDGHHHHVHGHHGHNGHGHNGHGPILPILPTAPVIIPHHAHDHAHGPILPILPTPPVLVPHDHDHHHHDHTHVPAQPVTIPHSHPIPVMPAPEIVHEPYAHVHGPPVAVHPQIIHDHIHIIPKRIVYPPKPPQVIVSEIEKPKFKEPIYRKPIIYKEEPLPYLPGYKWNNYTNQREK